jgi:hypothetical protein
MIRDLAAPENARSAPPQSMPVPRDLSQDIWAFRIIVRAFLAKAEAIAAQPEAWSDAEHLRFASEFARHYRRFGPRLAKATKYARTGPLTAAVSVLSNSHAVDATRLGLAARECERFVVHLDESRGHGASSALPEFDKERAADELRAYLATSRQRVASPAAAGAFGPRRGP